MLCSSLILTESRRRIGRNLLQQCPLSVERQSLCKKMAVKRYGFMSRELSSDITMLNGRSLVCRWYHQSGVKLTEKEPSKILQDNNEKKDAENLQPVVQVEKKGGKLKQFFSKYGLLGLSVWAVMWAVPIPILYVALSHGMFGANIMGLFAQYGVHINPEMGNLVAAMAINELIELIRFPLVLVVVVWIRKILDNRILKKLN